MTATFVNTSVWSQQRRPRAVCPPGSRRAMVVSHISQAGVVGSNCSHRGRVSFCVRRENIANIDTSRGSLERRASAILSRVRCSAAGKLNLRLQALVPVPCTATQDRYRKPASGRRAIRAVTLVVPVWVAVSVMPIAVRGGVAAGRSAAARPRWFHPKRHAPDDSRWRTEDSVGE